MWNTKRNNDTDELICKRNKDTDIEIGSMDTRGERGWNELGDWD